MHDPPEHEPQLRAVWFVIIPPSMKELHLDNILLVFGELHFLQGVSLSAKAKGLNTSNFVKQSSQMYS